MKNNPISIIILVIIVGAISFYAGTKYQSSRAPSLGSRQSGNFTGSRGINNQDPQGANRLRVGGGQIVGEIVSRDDRSITIKLADGSSKIVLLSASATVGQLQTIPATDLKTGDKVGIFGQTNSDGSITAQNIQLNPIDRRPSDTTAPDQ